MAAMPSTWDAAVLAWRDTRRAFVAMPAIAGIALAIVTAIELVETLAAPSARGSLGLSLLLTLARSRLVIYAAGLGPPAGIAGKPVAIVSNGAVSMLSLTLFVIIASRFYEWLGDRVKSLNGADGRQ
jgi:hypothetical protein